MQRRSLVLDVADKSRTSPGVGVVSLVPVDAVKSSVSRLIFRRHRNPAMKVTHIQGSVIFACQANVVKKSRGRKKKEMCGCKLTRTSGPRCEGV